MLGPSGVGKTCLLNYFNKKPNPKQTLPNIGITIHDFTINIKGNDCQF